VATTVSGRSFSYASGLRRRLQGPSAASSATCRSMSSSPGWPLTLDQQQNSVARTRSLYQEGVRNTLAGDRDIFATPYRSTRYSAR
jgi:hypothetical protein